MYCVWEFWQYVLCVGDLAVCIVCGRFGSMYCVWEIWQYVLCVGDLAVCIVCGRFSGMSKYGSPVPVLSAVN